MEDGESVAYSLFNLQDRGILFIGAGINVYEGMIIGQHAKENDLVVNAAITSYSIHYTKLYDCRHSSASRTPATVRTE